MGSWKKEAREKHSVVMKLHHAKKRQAALEALANPPKRGRGRPRKEQVAATPAVNNLERNLMLSVATKFMEHNQEVHRYVTKAFNDFMRSEAFSEAVKVRLDEYVQTLVEAEFTRLVNVINSQPKMRWGQRLIAAVQILKAGK
jgi:hypothetical protein